MAYIIILQIWLCYYVCNITITQAQDASRWFIFIQCTILYIQRVRIDHMTHCLMRWSQPVSQVNTPISLITITRGKNWRNLRKSSRGGMYVNVCQEYGSRRVFKETLNSNHILDYRFLPALPRNVFFPTFIIRFADWLWLWRDTVLNCDHQSISIWF